MHQFRYSSHRQSAQQHGNQSYRLETGVNRIEEEEEKEKQEQEQDQEQEQEQEKQEGQEQKQEREEQQEQDLSESGSVKSRISNI